MGLANISIVGNVVKPPAQTAFANGGLKTTLIVAVNSFKKGAAPDTQTAEFYKVEAWGKLGEIAFKYIPKGSQITAVGRFSIDRWQGNDGRERSTGVINASEISLPPKRAALEDASTTDPSSNLDAYPSPPAPAATPHGDSIDAASLPNRQVATSVGVEQDDFLSEAEEDEAVKAMYSKTLRVPAGGKDTRTKRPPGATADPAAAVFDGATISDTEADELFGTADSIGAA